MDKVNIVNYQDKIVGKANLDKVHNENLLHRSIHIFVIDSQGRLFCRRRSLKKERYPGYWSTSVGAHVLEGQTYNQVARKSLAYTLGINCKLKRIGKSRVHDRFENEISAVYMGYSNKEMKFNFQQIEGGKFLTPNEIKDLIKHKNVTPHLHHALKIYESSFS